jgi:hypothetical protein
VFMCITYAPCVLLLLLSLFFFSLTLFLPVALLAVPLRLVPHCVAIVASFLLPPLCFCPHLPFSYRLFVVHFPLVSCLLIFIRTS